MLEQVKTSISGANRTFSSLEENANIQRSLALTSLGVSLNQPKLLERAMEVPHDNEFGDQLQAIKIKKSEGENITKRDLLELTNLAEQNHLISESKKETAWKKANNSFSEVIESYKFNTDAVFIMQFITLFLFIGFLIYRYSQEKLREKMDRQEHLQSKLFASLSEGVFLCDSDGKILACNSSGSYIAGKEARDLAGSEFSSLFRGLELRTEDNKRISCKEYFQSLFKQGRSLFNLTLSVTNKSGHKNWYNLTTQPISPFGEGEGFNMLLSFNNITEKVLVHQQLKQQQVQMMEGSRLQTIGEMAGGIAHEINNPLSIIMATTERLDWKAERKGTVEGDTIRKSTSKVLKTVRRISEIVASLLAMSRDEEVDHKYVPIKEIIDLTMDLASIELAKNHVSFDIETDHLNELIQCFPTQIAQVLLNLTKNSIDAMENIENKWIKLKIKDDGDKFRFIVTDAGKGISKRDAEKILMPFYTTKEVGKGTGLGLSISRNIITNHHGEFFIDHEEEHTTFVFTIPKKFVDAKIDEDPDFRAAA
tara:strand:+ start:77587 stop:79197 length:1611 start_codon:yes stop_codon:yes gene_type:complete